MADFTALNWFNLSSPIWLLPAPHRSGKVFIRLWNLHRRHSAKDGRWWGAGLLQVGKRHLLYVGQDDGRWTVCALFCGQTQ